MAPDSKKHVSASGRSERRRGQSDGVGVVVDGTGGVSENIGASGAARKRRGGGDGLAQSAGSCGKRRTPSPLFTTPALVGAGQGKACLAGSSTVVQPPAPPPPRKWQAWVDHNTGDLFYQDTHSGNSVWDLPDGEECMIGSDTQVEQARVRDAAAARRKLVQHAMHAGQHSSPSGNGAVGGSSVEGGSVCSPIRYVPNTAGGCGVSPGHGTLLQSPVAMDCRVVGSAKSAGASPLTHLVRPGVCMDSPGNGVVGPLRRSRGSEGSAAVDISSTPTRLAPQSHTPRELPGVCAVGSSCVLQGEVRVGGSTEVARTPVRQGSDLRTALSPGGSHRGDLMRVMGAVGSPLGAQIQHVDEFHVNYMVQLVDEDPPQPCVVIGVQYNGASTVYELQLVGGEFSGRLRRAAAFSSQMMQPVGSSGTQMSSGSICSPCGGAGEEAARSVAGSRVSLFHGGVVDGVPTIGIAEVDSNNVIHVEPGQAKCIGFGSQPLDSNADNASVASVASDCSYGTQSMRELETALMRADAQIALRGAQPSNSGSMGVEGVSLVKRSAESSVAASVSTVVSLPSVPQGAVSADLSPAAKPTKLQLYLQLKKTLAVSLQRAGVVQQHVDGSMAAMARASQEIVDLASAQQGVLQSAAAEMALIKSSIQQCQTTCCLLFKDAVADAV